MDNAREFKSPKLEGACSIHGITPKWRPIGRKHYGGHIERLIGTMMTSHVQFLPGTTMSNVIARGKIESEKDAVLTISEFTKWFAGEVEIYNYKEHSALRCPPSEMWEKSFTSPTGLITQPTIITDPFKFRLDFMPEKRRQIHPVGVKLFLRKYWSPELKNLIGMRNVVIKYDPYALYTVWARVGKEYIELHFSDLTHEDFSYEEYLIEGATKRLSKPRTMRPGTVLIRDKNEEIVEEAKKTTKKSKKNEQAIKAYAKHTLNQHFGSQKISIGNPSSDIDFSKAPDIYEIEDE
ncbi:Mu transposase C-terminal domain-containing protein [Pseudomonas rubra]|uniref:Mu transposase C-terminal domain-containing protein n=1 Tax=Pseudomonas rubra TaxID=2942627 RepID=A0ABT5PC61_9PSED|nr:Mu transposase C-terminal domain-containing protein [Pseudomonas rubra]MDD1015900.1 Mu transposase C-terminal domain-containing protein [Pseudomonas rubra]MDD1040196.1 Mu transposase C-terminal domain-containing protein [Pseudomonas rubra]MDD1157928.1 Mu transposase C-terminal domain-containing protein [Pseudomonas rubra]